ncbi:hypothetical protein Bateq7PJ16_2554 [Bacillus subtilis]|uniref:Uncharacterized protein n=2 Tax=Bacillus subtilis TaxID=1423 RepID=A0AAP1E1M5_BACIU|nr:hypothetical protein I33_2361 [Bacillus subtilis subsp. subtilis str. RO-NN-1]AGE63947.1 hypothetical protein C663_2173 [Bacillus subtilis XF-1]AKN14296.1 hypothetical protein ABU16_3220 [Bacillus subtilis]EHA31524.1 hypothetical protein BSSC8_19670 [Bacillus subtilis subsp. subtilis str. SC-8]KIL33260.1 hypothetical protein B4067_2516 [Bacillus subtilis subsp. subtilis]CCU58802.1 hypothetical protein BSUBE1_2171 [Bacillus subtilis E1]BAI85799.1 hypothetical protein BSNT_08698 [Bacillus su
MQRKTADFSSFFSLKNMEKHNVYSMHRSYEGVYYSLKGSM